MAGEFMGPLGTLIGAGAGFAVGGPAGAAMGAKLGSAAGGLGSMFSGAMAKKKANALRPSEVDPSQLTRLEEAKRKLKAMESGTDVTTQAAVREASQLTESTKSDLSKVTGGNIAGTVDALLKSQRLGGSNINKIYAGTGQRASGFASLVDRMAERIETRKREIQQNKADQKFAESAEALQSGGQNFLTGLVSALPVDGKNPFGSIGGNNTTVTTSSANQIGGKSFSNPFNSGANAVGGNMSNFRGVIQ